jgi:hypothetical protein
MRQATTRGPAALHGILTRAVRIVTVGLVIVLLAELWLPARLLAQPASGGTNEGAAAMDTLPPIQRTEEIATPPFYKRWWFWGLVAVVVVGAVAVAAAGGGGGGNGGGGPSGSVTVTGPPPP